MAEYISTTAQTLAANTPIILQTTTVKGNCNIQHRDGTALIALRGSGCCCSPARYKVFAHVTATGTANPFDVALAVDGVILPETLISLPPSDGNILSGSTGATVISDFGSKISLVAVSGGIINTALISVDRVA